MSRTPMYFGCIVSCGYHADLAEAEKAVLAKRLELHTHNDLDRKAMAV